MELSLNREPFRIFAYAVHSLAGLKTQVRFCKDLDRRFDAYYSMGSKRIINNLDAFARSASRIFLLQQWYFSDENLYYLILFIYLLFFKKCVCVCVCVSRGEGTVGRLSLPIPTPFIHGALLACFTNCTVGRSTKDKSKRHGKKKPYQVI